MVEQKAERPCSRFFKKSVLLVRQISVHKVCTYKTRYDFSSQKKKHYSEIFWNLYSELINYTNILN